MPLPKKKQSKRRKRQRRSHDALTRPTVVTCGNCGQPMIPHRACPNCGYYKGSSVVSGSSL
jgi:large subunit ribosomal protein L32